MQIFRVGIVQNFTEKKKLLTGWQSENKGVLCTGAL
jgi:hypothetical protein